MRYVRKKEECSGCRACEQVCPKKCITVCLDEEGFLYPVIEEEKCINCKKCLEVCKIDIKKIFSMKRKAYAVKNINDNIRVKSSSGGVFYELAMETIKRKGYVYGAAFDENFQVKQSGTNVEKEISNFMGSKYVESDTGNTYQEVKKLLAAGVFVLYSGTPCQIKGLKNYLNREEQNLLCVSLICHGVPSMTVWERYVKLKMGQYAERKPTKISFRDKSDGWRNMSLKMDFSNVCYSNIHSYDIYFRGFNQNLFLRPACYHCRAKKDYADIVIGDFWGVEQFFPNLDDGQGVSSVIINSNKGNLYWEEIKNHFIIRESSVEDIMQKNPFLYKSVPQNLRREMFFDELKTTGLIEESIKDNLRENLITEETRQKYHYEIFKQYMRKLVNRESIFEAIIQRGYCNICLYAITDLTELVANDLQQSEKCKLIYICDRNHKAYQKGIWGIKVMNPQILVSDVLNKKIDLIVICNPMRENDIISELELSGISQEKMISIVSLIYS